MPLPLLIGALALSLPAAAAIDWDAVTAETSDLLSGYLRVDTINPPGNEEAGARYLQGWLDAAGIPSETHEIATGRVNLVARLKGSGLEPPLCLMSHLDVASAEAARWDPDRGPLSGAVADGAIWGRGALDMKGMGAIETMVMLLLAREGVALRRDVILLAVADEEVHNSGARALADRWSEIGCSHLINEGGVGIDDLFFPGQTVFPISVGEKGVLWTRVVATGEPGHGSTPLPDRSPERLVEAADRLLEWDPGPTWDPALMQLLANVGAHKGGLAGAILRRPLLVRSLLRRRLMGNPLTRAALTDTVNVTGFGGALEPNVVPAESWLQVDSRLLPGTSPEAMLGQLGDWLDDPTLRLEPIQTIAAQVSPWEDDPVYAALAREVVRDRPDAVAGPVISVGFTDSIYLRPLGVRAYGFVPFALSEEELRTMHGDRERVPVEELRRGVEVLYRVVLAVAAAP